MGTQEISSNVQVVGSYSERLRVKPRFFEKNPDKLAFDFGNVPAEVLGPMKLALKRQMYKDIMGTDLGRTSEEKLDKDLFRQLAPPGADRVNIVVRSVDPKDLTKSYLEMMKDFEKQKPSKFQERFMDSVISHFGQLGPKQTADRQKLAEALFQVRGQLPLESKRKLEDLAHRDSKASHAMQKAQVDSLSGRNRDLLDSLRERENPERAEGGRRSEDSLRRKAMIAGRDAEPRVYSR